MENARAFRYPITNMHDDEEEPSTILTETSEEDEADPGMAPEEAGGTSPAASDAPRCRLVDELMDIVDDFNELAKPNRH
ncbi:MAG: hypothetical protein IVW57_11555 [Ktedonobacterales bacterium]|nr:hypothetical protein [Ktedonobacterales bacterium]